MASKAKQGIGWANGQMGIHIDRGIRAVYIRTYSVPTPGNREREGWWNLPWLSRSEGDGATTRQQRGNYDDYYYLRQQHRQQEEQKSLGVGNGVLHSRARSGSPSRSTHSYIYAAQQRMRPASEVCLKKGWHGVAWRGVCGGEGDFVTYRQPRFLTEEDSSKRQPQAVPVLILLA